ncbi:hypothetical protein Trydic_g20577 [Trypoxylus dichotomus]
MIREAEKDGSQGVKTLLKRAECQHQKEEHLHKPMHGQYFKLVSEQGLSPELSFSYLTSPTPYSETEGYITAVQDGVFHTLAYAKRVFGVPLEDTRCGACRAHEETVMHLLSAYPRTTTQLPHNKPDLVILDSLEKKMYVIEMSCLPILT